MSFKKNVIIGVLTAGISMISVCSYAQPLTIVNNTDQDSTSVINGGLCSTVFGSGGVTKAHSTNVVSEGLITLACALNSSNCRADIYMTNNCSGPIIATAVFDTKTGMKSIDVFGGEYKFAAAAFDIKIDKLA